MTAASTLIKRAVMRASVAEMSDAAFARACARRAWRDPPAVIDPAEIAPNARRFAETRAGVLGMTDREFLAACRSRAWRNAALTR
jgi:hypothetical protein